MSGLCKVPKVDKTRETAAHSLQYTLHLCTAFLLAHLSRSEGKKRGHILNVGSNFLNIELISCCRQESRFGNMSGDEIPFVEMFHRFECSVNQLHKQAIN